MKNILLLPPFRPSLVWRCKHSQPVLQNELFDHFQSYFSGTFLDRRWFKLEKIYLTILGPNLYWNGYSNWQMFYLVECWLESRRACRFDSEESFSTSDLTDNRLDFGKTTPASPQPCVIGEISVRANKNQKLSRVSFCLRLKSSWTAFIYILQSGVKKLYYIRVSYFFFKVTF